MSWRKNNAMAKCKVACLKYFSKTLLLLHKLQWVHFCTDSIAHFITSPRWKFPALLKVCLYCLSNLVLKILLLCVSQIHNAVCGLIIQLHISTCTYKGPKSATLEENSSWYIFFELLFWNWFCHKHLMIFLSSVSNCECGLFP